MTQTKTQRADERLALDLMAAIRAHVEQTCAPNHVELVSTTIDATGHAVDGAVSFSPRIDRRTRTVVFAAGTASTTGHVVMSATVVYRIVSTT